MVNPTSLETTTARYAIPANCSSITSTRAGGVTGTMSLNPVAERFVKLRKSSFKKRLAVPGRPLWRNLPGTGPGRPGKDWQKPMQSWKAL